MMIFVPISSKIVNLKVHRCSKCYKHYPAAETVWVGGVVTLDAAVGVGDGEVIYGHIIGVGDLIPIPSMMKF